MNQARDGIAGLTVMHPFPGMVAGLGPVDGQPPVTGYCPATVFPDRPGSVT